MTARYNARDEQSRDAKTAALRARHRMTASRVSLAMLLSAVLLFAAGLRRKAEAQAISSMNSESLKQSADWPSAVEQLARKILVFTGPNPVNVVVENSLSVGPQELAEVKRLVDGRLRLAGIQPSTATGAAYTVKITVSENARGFVLAAETSQSGGEPGFAIVTAAGSAPDVPSNVVSLHKTLLLRQDAPLLDVQLLNAGTLVVLGPDRITTYGKQAAEWQSISSAEIATHHAMPRDIRGRLAVRGDGFDAYLPGMVCSMAALSPLGIGCRDSDDPWPISVESALYNASRNYFTRATGNFSEDLSRFYSAAFFRQSRTEPHVVFTTPEGVMRYSPTGPLPVEAPGWGSDVALLYNGSSGVAQNTCSGSHILAASDGDYSQSDSLRAFEVHGQHAVAASDPIEFAGPVLALWSAPDLTSVTAIAHNQKTGSYEAYSITASCLQ